MPRLEAVKGVCPAVFRMQHLGFFRLAVLQQVHGDAVIPMVFVAVRPDLPDGKQIFIVGLHVEDPVHLPHPVGKPIIQGKGDTQLDLQCGRLAGAENPQELVALQAVQLIGGGFIDQLRAIPDLHRKLGKEFRHGGQGLPRRHLGADGIGSLTVGLGPHIEVYTVAVCGSVGEGNGLRHRIAGHQIFEIAEQVGFRVLAAGPEVEALREALKGNGGGVGKGPGGKAHGHEHQ